VKLPSTGQLKCDGIRAETRFRLSAKRTSPFKSAGVRQFSRLLAAEVCASAVVMVDTSMFRGIVKGTGYPLHSPVSPSFPLPASPCAITFQLESTLDFVTLKFQAISPHQAGPTASSADSSTGLKPCTALYYVTTLRNQSIGEEMCKKKWNCKFVIASITGKAWSAIQSWKYYISRKGLSTTFPPIQWHNGEVYDVTTSSIHRQSLSDHKTDPGS